MRSTHRFPFRSTIWSRALIATKDFPISPILATVSHSPRNEVINRRSLAEIRARRDGLIGRWRADYDFARVSWKRGPPVAIWTYPLSIDSREISKPRNIILPGSRNRNTQISHGGEMPEVQNLGTPRSKNGKSRNPEAPQPDRQITDIAKYQNCQIRISG